MIYCYQEGNEKFMKIHSFGEHSGYKTKKTFKIFKQRNISFPQEESGCQLTQW